MAKVPSRTWPYTPVRGWTADDLDNIGAEGPYGELDLLKHVELVDGALVIMSPQTAWHRAVIMLFARELAERASPHLTATSEMDIKLSERQRPVPDVLVISREASEDLTRTCYLPEEISLVAEVVSEESQVRERKPQLYARAGIPFYWRIENVNGKPVVFTFELDPANSSYASGGVFHDRLKTSVPFPLDIDLSRIR
jgi:Uma2 family endonuclease